MNNTILAGVAPNRVCIEETSTTGDLRVVQNNNLFGATVLYRDEGTTDLTTPSQLAATLLNATGNISAEPLIAGPLE